jgi:hypothetical protein
VETSLDVAGNAANMQPIPEVQPAIWQATVAVFARI